MGPTYRMKKTKILLHKYYKSKKNFTKVYIIGTNIIRSIVNKKCLLKMFAFVSKKTLVTIIPKYKFSYKYVFSNNCLISS